MPEIVIRERPAGPLSTSDIVALWERLLDFAPIAEGDNFFDLGGDSLQALQLFREIERVTDRKLPLTAIYEAATPAALAALLKGDGSIGFSPLVLLKAGNGAPLFVVHGIGGNVVELEQLGRILDTPQPVYAIQAQGVDGASPPLSRIEDMVALYLAYVRAAQPRGPYFLAGYSFGGMVAMEMARRLQEEGDKVVLLAFIDSFAHPDTFPKSARHLVRLGVAAHAFRTKPFGEALNFVIARLRNRSGNAMHPGQMLANFAPAISAPLQAVYDAAFDALNHYVPRPYDGEVHFFRPKTSIFPIAPHRVWGKLVGRLSVHNVLGDHATMLRDHAPNLAAVLSRTVRVAATR